MLSHGSDLNDTLLVACELTSPNSMVCHLQAMAVADRFQHEWDLELRLFQHDCRHHTEALVARLTGREYVALKTMSLARRSDVQRRAGS